MHREGSSTVIDSLVFNQRTSLFVLNYLLQKIVFLDYVTVISSQEKRVQSQQSVSMLYWH